MSAHDLGGRPTPRQILAARVSDYLMRHGRPTSDAPVFCDKILSVLADPVDEAGLVDLVGFDELAWAMELLASRDELAYTQQPAGVTAHDVFPVDDVRAPIVRTGPVDLLAEIRAGRRLRKVVKAKVVQTLPLKATVVVPMQTRRVEEKSEVVTIAYKPTVVTDELRALNRECYERQAAADRRRKGSTPVNPARAARKTSQDLEVHARATTPRVTTEDLFDAAESGLAARVAQLGARAKRERSNEENAEMFKHGGLGPDGWTGLMRAALFGFAPVLRELLKLGADVSRQNIYGQTALELAVANGKQDAVQILLAAGAAKHVELHAFGAVRAAVRRGTPNLLGLDAVRRLFLYDEQVRVRLEGELDEAQADAAALRAELVTAAGCADAVDRHLTARLDEALAKSNDAQAELKRVSKEAAQAEAASRKSSAQKLQLLQEDLERGAREQEELREALREAQEQFRPLLEPEPAEQLDEQLRLAVEMLAETEGKLAIAESEAKASECRIADAEVGHAETCARLMAELESSRCQVAELDRTHAVDQERVREAEAGLARERERARLAEENVAAAQTDAAKTGWKCAELATKLEKQQELCAQAEAAAATQKAVQEKIAQQAAALRMVRAEEQAAQIAADGLREDLRAAKAEMAELHKEKAMLRKQAAETQKREAQARKDVVVAKRDAQAAQLLIAKLEADRKQCVQASAVALGAPVPKAARTDKKDAGWPHAESIQPPPPTKREDDWCML